MPVPVYLSPSNVDGDELVRFRDVVAAAVGRHGAIVIDCAELTHMSNAGMRVLENASREGDVTLVHASPIMRLLACVYGIGVEHDAS